MRAVTISFVLPALAALALAGCEPRVPDSAAGVGAEVAAQGGGPGLKGHETAAPRAEAAPRTGGDPAGAQAANRPRGNAPTTITPEIGEMTTIADKPGISDEQSFSAVTARETIESDKERLARQRAEYKVIKPTALPQRTGAAGPNIVQYALATSNPMGHQLYRRLNPFRRALSARACARYPSDDKAQEAFLAAGGPERDPHSLDPDGDGYACAWDPAPFRAAKR